MTLPRLPRLAAGLSLLGAIALTTPTVVLGHTLNATYTSRLPLAVYLAGAAATVALSFIFVLVRDVRAERPDVTRRGPDAAGRAAHPAPGARARRLAMDRHPGHRRRRERRRGGHALHLGLRLGRRGDGLGDHRAGVALPGPVLDAPRHRRRDRPSTRHRAVGDGRVPRVARSLARRHRFRGRRLARAGAGGRTPGPLRRARRLHGLHARDDGPVRPRHLALERRGLHRLVPPARPPRAVRPRRRGRAHPAPTVPDRPPRTGLEPGRCRDHRPRGRLDPVRWPVADPDLVRPVRLAVAARQDRAAHRLPRDHRPARARGDAVRRDRRHRGGPPADRHGLPDRPLPDLPADQRPDHHHRDLGPAPERLGPVRDRVLPGVGRVAAAGSRVDRAARGGRRRPHARRVGWPRGGGARGATGTCRRRRSGPGRSRWPS